MSMLEPNQFYVNEAWIAFKLNGDPVRTEKDGDFNCIALMDAASCFMLGTTFVPVDDVEPSQLVIRQLMAKAQAHKQQLPKTLFIPTDEVSTTLELEARNKGITVVRVSVDQLLIFIGEARKGFNERFN